MITIILYNLDYHSFADSKDDNQYVTSWTVNIIIVSLRASDSGSSSLRLILFPTYLRPLRSMQLLFHYWYGWQQVAYLSLFGLAIVDHSWRWGGGVKFYVLIFQVFLDFQSLWEPWRSDKDEPEMSELIVRVPQQKHHSRKCSVQFVCKRSNCICCVTKCMRHLDNLLRNNDLNFSKTFLFKKMMVKQIPTSL